MRIISEFVRRHSFTLYGLAIFLIRFPPMYLFVVKSSLFNSYNISGYLLALLLFFKVFDSWKTGGKTLRLYSIFAPVALFFVSQSLSVIGAVNVFEFISSYKDLVFAILVFTVTIFEVDSKDKLIQVSYWLLLSVFINLAFQLVMYFQWPFFNFVSSLLTGGYVQDFEINASRNRYFVDSYDAALIPIVFMIFARTKEKMKKFGLIVAGISVSAMTFLSNFRAQLVVLFVSMVAGSLLYFKKKADAVRFLVIIGIIFYFINIITSISLGYNALDRLISPQESDLITIEDRFYYWNLAVKMGLSKPFFGVGLGNFYDYIPGEKAVSLSLFDWKNDFFKITWVHPHNLFFGVFAETGFVGLISLLAMLGYFLAGDIQAIMKYKKRSLNLIIVSYWLVFAFSLINAPISLSYLGLFWLLRGLIYVHARHDFSL